MLPSNCLLVQYLGFWLVIEMQLSHILFSFPLLICLFLPSPPSLSISLSPSPHSYSSLYLLPHYPSAAASRLPFVWSPSSTAATTEPSQTISANVLGAKGHSAAEVCLECAMWWNSGCLWLPFYQMPTRAFSSFPFPSSFSAFGLTI